MSNKTGYLKQKSTGDVIIPKTSATAVHDEAKNQALSQTLLNTPDKGTLGYPSFSTVVGYAAGEVVYYNNQLWRFVVDHAAGAWNTGHVEAFSVSQMVAELSDGLAGGSFVPAMASNIESWGDGTERVDDEQAELVSTTGGSVSINSNVKARLLDIVPQGLEFGATSLVATGFNLMRKAVQVGGGQVWYFVVPYLVFGAYGTADENNGVLFTGSNGEAMTPTVYWKALMAGVPVSATDGEVVGYTVAGGLRFYTTPAGHEGECGYFIVQATRATTCAHIGWSKRYDEYVGVGESSDAGAEVALGSVMNAIHSNGLMYSLGLVTDAISVDEEGQVATWVRRVDRVKASTLEWENEVQEDGVTYRHSAEVGAMKSDGVVYCEGKELAVEGQVVSYIDEKSTAMSEEMVYYELAEEVSGTVRGNYQFAVEDWGLVYLVSSQGKAYMVISYGQNLVDTVRAYFPTGKENDDAVVSEALNALHGEVEGLKAYMGWIEWMLTPSTGEGAPSVRPGRIGEEYIDTTTGSIYKAVGVREVSDWKQIG